MVLLLHPLAMIRTQFPKNLPMNGVGGVGELSCGQTHQNFKALVYVFDGVDVEFARFYCVDYFIFEDKVADVAGGDYYALVAC